ncbi:MAG: hypothetical protein LBU83_05525, partial [Bacteroidales bacterium]|jgi:hypothetical protein|nr:hypothetical protein [Bacteroidales bacterium]
VNDKWFADTLYCEIKDGFIKDIETYQGELYVVAETTSAEGEYGYVKRYIAKNADEILVKTGDKIVEGTPIFKGKFINDSFYVALARMFLVIIFLSGCFMVMLAVRKRKKIKTSVKPKTN